MVAAVDAVGVDGFVRLPQHVGGPGVRWTFDAVGEFLDVGETDVVFAGLVHDLDRGDLVAVLVEVGVPGVDDGAGPVGIDGAVGVKEFIDADLVDDPVVAAA